MAAYQGDVEFVIKAINDEFVGATIVRAELSPPIEDAYDEHSWYKIILELPDGRTGYLEPSIDPEGNAPGFLFMEIEV